MLGSENQRAAMRSKASGVHRLTTAMKREHGEQQQLGLQPRARSATRLRSS